jgi:hypothetical protein
MGQLGYACIKASDHQPRPLQRHLMNVQVVLFETALEGIFDLKLASLVVSTWYILI